MHKDFIKEKIRLEQHKFEIVYIKNLWALIIFLGGFLLILLQLFFDADATKNRQFFLVTLIAIVSIGLVVGFMRYFKGREEYMKELDSMLHRLEKIYD
ncbi:MAG: hypothetical protein HY564_02935 [Candidatus Jacksonbacteria bacterium]|nr:hypothetical protein [Candidatus Jacksonbacteria bacterium]